MEKISIMDSDRYVGIPNKEGNFLATVICKGPGKGAFISVPVVNWINEKAQPIGWKGMERAVMVRDEFQKYCSSPLVVAVLRDGKFIVI